MRKLMRHYHFILVLLIFFDLACSKKEYDNHDPCGGHRNGTIAISSNLVSLKFKPGSYWVYIDSVTAMIDSLYLRDFSQGYSNDACSNAHEYYSFSTVSFPSSKINNYKLQDESFLRDNYETYYGKTIHSDYDSLSFGNSIVVIQYFDSLFIFNQYYKDVTKTKFYRDPLEGYKKSVYYLNSEFGFLGKDIFDLNDILLSQKLLQRCNIVR